MLIQIKTYTNGTVLFATNTAATFLAALEQAVQLRVNLNDANLANLALAGANLRAASLRDANMSNANLQGANLRQANLQGVNMQYAQLQDSNLEYTILTGAKMQGAITTGASRTPVGKEPGADLYRLPGPPSPFAVMTIEQFQIVLAAASAPILNAAQLAVLLTKGYPPNSVDANTMGIAFMEAGVLFTQQQAAALGYYYPQPAKAQLGYSGGLE